MESAHGSRITYMVILGVILVLLAAFLVSKGSNIKPVPAEPGQWKQNFVKAGELNEQKDFSASETLLAGTVDQARSEGKDTTELAKYLVRYAFTVYSQMKYEQMIPIAQEAESLIDSLPEDKKPEAKFIFNNYSNIASSYFFVRKFAMAEPYIKRAIAIMNKPGASVSLATKKRVLEIHQRNLIGLNRKTDAAKVEAELKHLK